MNDNLVVPNQGSWPVGPFGNDQASQLERAQRSYSAYNILDFSSLFRILYHWRYLILTVVAVGLAIGLLVTLLTTPVYRAWVTLEANPPAFSVSDDQSQEMQDTSLHPGNFVATQVGLLSSKSVAERTVQELNLAQNPEFIAQTDSASTRLKEATAAVRDGLHVTPAEDGELIQFSFDSTSPQLAALIANGIADSFINTSLQRRYEASAYARDFLERQINKTRGDLERSERSLVAYAQAQGIINTGSTTSPDGKQTGSDASSLQGDSLVKLNNALADATARRVAAEGAYRQDLATGPTADVTTSTLPLRQQLATLRADYQQKRSYMKPDHPDMVSLQAQINELSREIAMASAQASSSRNNSLLADYRAAASAERALQVRVAQLKGDVLDLRGRSIQYNILQREVDTNRALYDALLQRYKEIGVAGGVGVSPVSIVDRADPPTFAYKPDLLTNLLVGLGLGLLLGGVGAVGIEILQDTIKTREDVRQKLRLACLGTVPKTGANDEFIGDLKNPASAVSEAYSAIAAALRFSTETGMPRTVQITSTRSGEGKSSTALALAQNFARRGRRVLLIDGDLRKPAFKSSNDRLGLSRLLTAEGSLHTHLLATQYANLWLLPSGPLPPNSADLLSTGRLRKIVSEAAEGFDFVVIDGPPTLGLADAPLIAASAENVLFVVEAGKTRTRAAVEALNRLEGTGAHILGVTLTKSKDSRADYGYGYGYGYGKARFKGTEILMIPQEKEEAPKELTE